MTLPNRRIFLREQDAAAEPREAVDIRRGASAAPVFAASDAAGGGAPGPEGRSAPPKPLAGLRILVVEDEALIALEIEDMLDALGARVVGTAASADEAVALAERHAPDCVTMDVRLAGPRDGVEAALEIAARFGIRSLFMSAYGEPALRARAEAARPIGWLRKPFFAADIAEALRALRA